MSGRTQTVSLGLSRYFCVPNIPGVTEIIDTSAGGKAYGLARLVGMGLSVPPAFVVRNARAEDFPNDLDRRYQDLGEVPVAVRSSALGEDGDDASFAGQYDTVLNVRGATELRQAIQDHYHFLNQNENMQLRQHRMFTQRVYREAIDILAQSLIHDAGTQTSARLRQVISRKITPTQAARKLLSKN